jgi:hypothetical protein
VHTVPNYHTVRTVPKYHTVRTVPKSNQKVVERSKIDTSNTFIHDCSLSWLGICTLIRSGGVAQCDNLEQYAQCDIIFPILFDIIKYYLMTISFWKILFQWKEVFYICIASLSIIRYSCFSSIANDA